MGSVRQGCEKNIFDLLAELLTLHATRITQQLQPAGNRPDSIRFVVVRKCSRGHGRRSTGGAKGGVAS